jgi:hypothetical protein
VSQLRCDVGSFPVVLFLTSRSWCSDAINIAEKIIAVIVRMGDSREWLGKENQSLMWVIEKRGYTETWDNPSRGLFLDQLQIASAAGRLGAIANSQLAIDVAGMCLDGIHRDHQAVSDRPIGHPGGDEAQQL